MKLQTELAASLQDTPVDMLLALTKQLYAVVKDNVASGHGTQADIRALNAARKEISACEQLGIGG